MYRISVSVARAGIRLAALSVAFAAVSSCSVFRHPKNAPALPPRPKVALRVQNENYLDMNVAVVSHGVSRRVGTVPGNGSAKFTLESSMVDLDAFSLLATPIGGSGRAQTQMLTVTGGQEVEFRIASVLRQSSVVVH